MARYDAEAEAARRPCECPNPKGLSCRRCYELAAALDAVTGEEASDGE